MTLAPYIEAPTARYLQEFWRMVHRIRRHYPMFVIPRVEFINEGPYPVYADLDRWTLMINPDFPQDPRPYLIRELTVLLAYHATGKVMSPRFKLYREIKQMLEAA